jgi:hypothetical protein
MVIECKSVARTGRNVIVCCALRIFRNFLYDTAYCAHLPVCLNDTAYCPHLQPPLLKRLIWYYGASFEIIRI